MGIDFMQRVWRSEMKFRQSKDEDIGARHTVNI